MSLIEIKNLRREYDTDDVKTKVLHGLSFSIDKGEFVSIMGPSGSGKSTLMHILGLLDRPSSGSYHLDGKNVANLSDNELASLRNQKIGFVFQSFNLLPRTDVLDNVKLPLIYSRGKKNIEDKAKQVLESVGLSHRLHYQVNQISGGEKQRVAIARALVNDPDIIFADEPTGNLDSKTGTQIMKILQELNEQGHTIILVTHEIYTAEHAKRIIRVKDGVIVSDHKVERRRKASEEELIK